MPIYEYMCNKCQQRFEKLLRTSNQPVDCPNCNSSDLNKLFSTFSSPVAEDVADFCPPGGCGHCPDRDMCMN